MKVQKLIEDLRVSRLYAGCPQCGGEFNLSKATLFDGLGKFPEDAQSRVLELEQGLKELDEEIKKKRKRATEGAERTATAVGAGKILEKVLPELKNFDFSLPDCRFLAEPIDMVVFNGCTNNKVRSVSFVEVKSGGARLNPHQKAVRDTIEDKKVRYKEVK